MIRIFHEASLSCAGAVAIIGSVALAIPANAQLALTPTGVADGFGLSTVITGIPSTTGYCCGPLGSATNSAGQIVMQVYQSNNYVFKDVDGQTFSAALSSATPPVTVGSYGMAITNDNGTLYAGNNDAGGLLVKLNNDGSFNSFVSTTPGGTVAGHGISTNPVTHDIVAASASGIWDINPISGVAAQISTYGGFDGVSVSADGKTIYAAGLGAIYGYNYLGAIVYTSPSLGSPDGTGVIGGSGKYAGDIVTNNNDGTVWLLDPNGLLPDGAAYEEIASGGTRGDYVGVDSTNGSLFLSQTNELDRLTCGTGCGFVSGGPSAPEASTWAMMLLGFAGLSFAGYRSSRKAASIAA